MLADVSSLEETTLKTAGIGRQSDHVLDSDIRRDRIQWIEATSKARRLWLETMESLRTHLNRTLYLGLFSYESHFAVYDSGAFYQKHRDAFRGKSNRVLSTVFYLNQDWRSEDGGQLKLYSDDEQLLETVEPEAGTLLIFLSEEFPHEVTAARRKRYSIAGWFRINQPV